MVLTSNCIAGPSGSIGLFHQLSNYSNLGDQRLPFVPPLPRQFFTSNSLAAHLGGGRCGQGGVPVTEGPKVLSFQGFGEGNSKVLDTVTGGDLDRAARSHTLAATELLELTSTGSAF